MSTQRHAWHQNKSIHNFQTFQYLNQKNPTYLDWEIIVIFYSSCKLVDAFLISNHNTKPSDHFQRGRLIRSHIRQIWSSYRNLLILSKTARYDADVIDSDRIDALNWHAQISNVLTPVI